MRKSLVLAPVLVGLAWSIGRSSQPQRVTGFFSDFAYSEKTGDVGGAEIFISYALVNNGLESRHYAYVQIAEGGPGEPQLVPVAVQGSRITFSLRRPYDAISPFVATVTRDSLIGHFTNGWVLRLPRRPSYWQ